MTSLRVVCCALVLLGVLRAADEATAAGIASALGQLSVDSEQTYRVRDVQLARGDINIYLTEGVLSFVQPVGGRCIAAVFTTEGVEAGDAEILVLPPRRSERASLASFAKTPNLDEHFTSAVFLFSDSTADELLTQLHDKPVHKVPELATKLGPVLNNTVRAISAGVSIRVVQALLDNHQPAKGFFYGVIGGRDLGAFDVMYDPAEFEPVSVGAAVPESNGGQKFQLWTSFRPRRAPLYSPPPAPISDYRIEADIHSDLSMTVTAAFHLVPNATNGRVVLFGLSDRLRVVNATLDGKPVEVFQPQSALSADPRKIGTFLIVSTTPFEAGKQYNVEVRYSGSVIRQTGNGSFFVDERNIWYPYISPMLTTFDLTFHCPEQLRLVSTGDPISDAVAGGIRTVHRKTELREGLAGFNLGDYDSTSDDRGFYRVECYANKPASEGLADIAKQTENLLDYYTQRWTKLPIHSLSVSPIPGYFGQGFPGLVYLSTISYMRLEERPALLRGEQLDTFFSAMLLAHEVAHQWWGNIVIPADYRTTWLIEAMANYSALQYLEKTHGPAAVDAVLDRYRDDLIKDRNGKCLDEAGPLDFGQRLIDSVSSEAWHTIIYEKGTWVLHMLRQRLGADAFNKMQLRLLQDFATKPLTNEDFRKIAGEFVPAGQPDKTLALFFDTWVYGTGIPKLALTAAAGAEHLDVSRVDEDFTFDVPLRCRPRSGEPYVKWLRATSGSNELETRGPGTCELPAFDAYLYSR